MGEPDVTPPSVEWERSRHIASQPCMWPKKALKCIKGLGPILQSETYINFLLSAHLGENHGRKQNKQFTPQPSPGSLWTNGPFPRGFPRLNPNCCRPNIAWGWLLAVHSPVSMSDLSVRCLCENINAEKQTCPSGHLTKPSQSDSAPQPHKGLFWTNVRMRLACVGQMFESLCFLCQTEWDCCSGWHRWPVLYLESATRLSVSCTANWISVVPFSLPPTVSLIHEPPPFLFAPILK